jgi:protein O-mannosyl-transferase
MYMKTKSDKNSIVNAANAKQDTKVLVLMAFVALLAIIATYWNHFDNDFHFDDSHTVVDNVYIRDVKTNYKKYFTDARTLTPLPANQSYRPVVALSYGLDYWISLQLGKSLGQKITEMEKAGNYNNPQYKALVDKAVDSKYIVKPNDPPKPFVFHISNFFWYLVQGVLMYFLIAKVFEFTAAHRYNRFFALFATAWYMLHTANAETVNYICARTDSYSTLFVVLAFVMYQYWQPARKYYLFLIPMFLGILAKPSALMFAPLLIVYIFLIEQQLSLLDIFKAETWKKLFTVNVLLAMVIPMLVAVLGYVLVEKKTPETFVASVTGTADYMVTQTYVWLLYFITFFLPTHLSADTDLYVFTVADKRFAMGVAFVLALFATAIFTTRNKQLRPIAFGLFWFILALLPSSSFKALSEAMNDHRMFFPFIGLVIAVTWALVLLYRKLETKGNYRGLFAVAGLLILGGHANGTIQRNQVWDNDESLWLDVTEKSPNNGRGLMNYGLTQYNKSFIEMAKGNKQEAIALTSRAISYYKKGIKLSPTYSYLNINLALAYETLGNQVGQPNKYFQLADEYFKRGQMYAGTYHGGYYYYAVWLWKQGKKTDAIWNAQQALNYGPDYDYNYILLMDYYLAEYRWDDLQRTALQMQQRFPSNPRLPFYLQAAQKRQTKTDQMLSALKANPTADGYLALSLEYYTMHQYENCIMAAEEALKINPKYDAAYNNICTAHNALGNFDKAIEACNKALAITPNYPLAKGNLDFAVNTKKVEADVAAKPTAEGYINIGLRYHLGFQYAKAIQFYEKAIQLKPNFGLAYNNICSAYNDMGQYAKAIPYGQKAVELDPTNERFKNNLAAAKAGK